MKWLISISLVAMTFTAQAAEQKPCKAKAPHVDSRTLVANSSQDIRAFAAAPAEEDPRIPFSELEAYAARGPREAAIAEIVRKAAPSVALIVSVVDKEEKDVRPPTPYLGTGWLIGSSCHVITTRHEINNAIEMEDGLSYREGVSPIGYKVSLNFRNGSGGTSSPYQGTVIKAGPSIKDSNDDFAIIRLSKRSPSSPLIANENLTIYPKLVIPFEELVTLQFPADRQANLKFPEMYFHPCNRINNGTRADTDGVPTNCSGMPGASGGPVLAPMVPVGSIIRNPDLASTGLKKGAKPPNYSFSQIMTLEKWGPEIAKRIQKDLDDPRSPCYQQR
jgi:hypothetical protein